MNIPELIQNQKEYFLRQHTKNIDFRKDTLKRLRKEILRQENTIIAALHEDFRKSAYETFMTEIAIVLSELDLAIKKIHIWNKPKKVLPSLLNFPSTARVYPEPYGTVLIISPWNYPFQLAFSPLIGAIAAGNTVILKPSELTPKTTLVLSEIITNVFRKEHVCIIAGGVEIAQKLLTHRWDYIFFTGSVDVGKIIAKAAATHLTPITLELGGKSPCIIDSTANLKLSAKRIVWGKFLNGGQTCIAPDYILLHSSIKETFIKYFKEALHEAYGENPEHSIDFPRIINAKNFDRLTALLKNQNCIIGGQVNAKDNYIAPTLIDEPALNSPVMRDEIFGPILPLLSFQNERDLETILLQHDKPLALYIFSSDKSFIQRIITKFSFGGGTINDTMVHFTNHRLPFGGVGESGMGSYHGKRTFDTFSHQKGIVRRGTWLDIPTRYAPYRNKLKQLKKLMKFGSL